MNKFYVTTPIYYVNDIPHIGHAYTTIAADAIARYWREKLEKDNVFFLTGTDEHGAKIATAAAASQQTPQAYVDAIAPRFKEAWQSLAISYDYFFRTTNPKHEKIVQDLLQKLYEEGYIYPGTYEGWYCEGCERFLTEKELVDGKCPLHPNKEPQYQKEKNYFFKLSSFTQDLIQLFESDTIQILPSFRKNEILGKLREGLQDISISREEVSWGIPLPWDEKQTIYVWIDALFNYYTATQFIANKKDFWPPDLHIVGKDILWFHTVIWISFLKAAGLSFPKKVFAHGFFTVNGQKMSKSLGNAISPQELVDTFGVDATRYLLLSEFAFGQDGDFSISKMQARYNAELADNLGNLVSRLARLCEQSGFSFPQDTQEEITAIDYDKAFEEVDLYKALETINVSIREYNQYLNQTTPWKLLKEGDTQKAEEVLTYLVTRMRKLATLLAPFMPTTAETIATIFEKEAITTVTKPLFPKIQ